MSPKPLKGRLFKNSGLTTRQIAAPITAVIMAGILYVYSRSSIYAAKSNAQRHREADGGQISWQNESARRHGVLQKPQEPPLFKQLIGRPEKKNDIQGTPPTVTPEEEMLKAKKVRKGGG